MYVRDGEAVLTEREQWACEVRDVGLDEGEPMVTASGVVLASGEWGPEFVEWMSDGMRTVDADGRVVRTEAGRLSLRAEYL